MSEHVATLKNISVLVVSTVF